VSSQRSGVRVRDAAVAQIARLLGEPTARCPVCQQLLRLVAAGTMLPAHFLRISGHSWCPGSEQPAVTR
jgi:hypothetical protein